MTRFRHSSRPGLDSAAAAALIDVLDEPKFELIPLKSVEDGIEHLPAGASVTVTASPSMAIEQTIELATSLQRRGFRSIPHLAAHMIADRGHLQTLLDELARHDVDRAFVVGGDAPDPGAYRDALSLLRDMEQLGHHFTEIGIACYPEGHPFIPPTTLLQALRDKAAHAGYMTSQMCFDPEAIIRWVGARRAEGIDLPLHLGIPGAAGIAKLVRLSARIGVGDSRRYLSKNTRLLGRLVKPGGFAADGLLDGLGPGVADPRLAIDGIHLFTFNEIADTEAWRHDYLATLRVDLETDDAPA